MHNIFSCISCSLCKNISLCTRNISMCITYFSLSDSYLVESSIIYLFWFSISSTFWYSSTSAFWIITGAFLKMVFLNVLIGKDYTKFCISFILYSDPCKIALRTLMTFCRKKQKKNKKLNSLFVTFFVTTS